MARAPKVQPARAAIVAELVAHGMDPALFGEAVDAYVRAMGDVALFRSQWAMEGSPGVTFGGATGQAIVPHPLVGLIDQAERRATDLRSRLLGEPKAAGGARRQGRPTGASSAPDRARPGVLRAVK